MNDVAIHLLGTVSIERGDSAESLSSRRQRALLAALALRPGAPVSVSELVDAVWGEEPPARARTTLQTYVSRIRSAFGDGLVVHGPGGYRLGPGVGSDADRARRLADEARSARPDDPAAAARLAAEALALWDGRSLGELADEEWFAPSAAGLDELRSNLVDVAVDALIAVGRATEAVELAETATRADPMREPTQVLLVTALGAAGRATEALRAADRYRRWLRDETGLNPGAELAAAEARILAGEAPPPPSPTITVAAPPSPSVLPRPGRLVGRQDELDRLAEALDRSRLVSVIGPGGVGKTRLVAEAVAGHEGASVVVELAPIGAGEIVTAVAAALGLREDGVDVPTVAERLRAEDALVVLDNAEHVVGRVREVVRTLLDRTPRTRVLVTSRLRLELPDEEVLPLAPLGIDGAVPPSVELFVERMRRSGASTQVDPADPAVHDVCVRMDGLPLALELAAGRAAVLGLDGLRARLDTALDLLASPAEDESRHASLRSVVAWSYELLDDPARRLLAVLSVFDGEFDLDAAEQVGDAVLDQPVSLMIGRLVDASLVTTTGVPGRYRLLEMIRQFGHERLEELGLVDAARDSYAGWAADRLDAVDALSVGPDEAGTAARLDALRHSVGRALRRAAETDDARLAEALLVALAGPALFRPDAGLMAAGNEVVERMLVRPDPPAAAVTAAGARLAFLSGHLDRVEPLVERTLTAGAGGDDRRARHRAVHALGVLRLYQSRFDEAAEAFESVIEDAGADLIDRIDTLGGVGLAYAYRGETSRAREVVVEYRAIAETVHSDAYRSFADYMEAEIELAEGHLDAAAGLLEAAAERAWSVGAPFVWGIAATVQAAVLVRHRPAAEAVERLPTLIERWRRSATWTQLWTTLRLVAELLADHGRADVAALLVIAADRDPAAPRLAGDDAARMAGLRGRLETALGAGGMAGVAAGAASLERVEVVERAVAALHGLAVD